MEKEYPLKQSDKDRRIDQVVLDIITNLTRSSSKSLLMEGIIKVNNQRVKPNYKVKGNDIVSIDEEAMDTFLNKQPYFSIKPTKVYFGLIYEDKDTIVVNKPSGISTHPVPGHREDTLLNGLVYYQLENSKNKNVEDSIGKIRPVHRLDKDTSGVTLFAKSRDAHVFYSEQFEKQLVEKTYYAVVKGDFKAALRGKRYITVQNYLARSTKERKKMVAVAPHLGQIAISKISMEGNWRGLNGTYSLVKITPKTGRTHQIRVHLSGLGFPVLGDPFYANTPYKRLMLHAYSLRIKKFKGEEVEFIAQLPKVFTL